MTATSESARLLDALTRSEERIGDGLRVRHRDFEIWPLVRASAIRALTTEARTASRPSPLAALRHLRRPVAQGLGLARPPRLVGDADAVLLSGRSYRQGTAESAVHVYGAPLARAFDHHGLRLRTWEWPNNPGDTRRPDGTSVDLILAMATTAARARARRPPAAVVRAAEEIVGPFVEETGVSLTVDEVVGRVLTVDAIGSVLGRALRGADVEVGLMTCFYGMAAFGFTLACRRNGIPTADVQHGAKGPSHVMYNRWATPDAALLPDRFWSWTPADETRDAAAFGAGRSFDGGNPTLSAHSAPSGGDRGGGPLRALVALQPGVGLPAGVASAAEDTSITWVLRAHPLMTEAQADALRWHTGAEVCVERPGERPLVDSLRWCDVHVTEFSSTVLEAAALGVPTILTSERSDAFADQLADGSAVLLDGRPLAGLIHDVVSRPETLGSSTEPATGVERLLASLR